MEGLVTFLGIFPTLIFLTVILVVIFRAQKKFKEKQHMEEYKRKKAEEEARETASAKSAADERRAKAAEMRGVARTFGLMAEDRASKHEKHVADSHAHGHEGEEEHYEEIVGSLGEVNDEGCADLSGVRFIASDLAYEIQSQETPDYDRLAQAMVLGEIINSPRFKTPYSKRK